MYDRTNPGGLPDWDGARPNPSDVVDASADDEATDTTVDACPPNATSGRCEDADTPPPEEHEVDPRRTLDDVLAATRSLGAVRRDQRRRDRPTALSIRGRSWRPTTRPRVDRLEPVRPVDDEPAACLVVIPGVLERREVPRAMPRAGALTNQRPGSNRTVSKGARRDPAPPDEVTHVERPSRKRRPKRTAPVIDRPRVEGEAICTIRGRQVSLVVFRVPSGRRVGWLDLPTIDEHGMIRARGILLAEDGGPGAPGVRLRLVIDIGGGRVQRLPTLSQRNGAFWIEAPVEGFGRFDVGPLLPERWDLREDAAGL